MRKAIRRGSAEEEVHKHRNRRTGSWKLTAIKDDESIQAMLTALRHGAWMVEEAFTKTCTKEKENRGGIQYPFYGTQVGDFMLR